jgi:tRNA (cytidine/uridine-2'-O-)-methyltransferase
MLRAALYQPDIAGNAGAVARLCACLGAGLDIIEPCGFVFSDKAFRRAAMDYANALDVARHANFEAFRTASAGRRLVLVETDGAQRLTDFRFRPDDTLVLGRESSGAGEDARAAAHASVFIPIRPGLRSLNLAVATAIVLAEALRQTDQMPR